MKRKKGFTLIELTVSLLILSIAMVGIANILIFSAKISSINDRKMDTSNYAQTVIQYYKSQGKNTIMQLYGISGSTYDNGSKYGYFNNMDELEALIENPATLTVNSTTNDSIMINGTTTKKFGLYIETSKSSILGTIPSTSTNVTISDKIKVIKIYVKVITMSDKDKHVSEFIFYKGR